MVDTRVKPPSPHLADSIAQISAFGYADRLLAWYDIHGRPLPWREKPIDPYRVFLSEIMLQQTTVATVKPYFARFLEKWPTLQALAQAQLDEVYHLWQGLGYYSRAKRLHQCAQTVSACHGGIFPSHVDELLRLPGIGPYTAAAIASIAYEQPAAVVDGNVVRVLSRVFTVPTPFPQSRPTVVELAHALTPAHRAGDYAQAIMDLGATVCRPVLPQCGACPWREGCAAHQGGVTHLYPLKVIKKTIPRRQATVFWLEDGCGNVWIRKRPAQGLLANLWEIPTSDWKASLPSPDDAPVERWPEAWPEADWRPANLAIHHTFTHFHLTLNAVKACFTHEQPSLPQGIWCAPPDMKSRAFSTLMRKVIQAMGEGGRPSEAKGEG